MTRRRLVRDKLLPYHVTARTNNREPFHLPLDVVWEVLANECLALTYVHQVEIQALVLMPNHFHMIATTPQSDLGRGMNMFMSVVTRTLNQRAGRSGRVFGGPYYWSLIGSSRYFGHALKYVYRNPVKSGLSDSVESYPFSTLHGLLGRSRLLFPVHMSRIGLEVGLPGESPIEMLKWLNTPFSSEAQNLIQKGLRRKAFDSTYGEGEGIQGILDQSL